MGVLPLRAAEGMGGGMMMFGMGLVLLLVVVVLVRLIYDLDTMGGGRIGVVTNSFAPHLGRTGKPCLHLEADIAVDRVGGRGLRPGRCGARTRTFCLSSVPRGWLTALRQI